MTRPVALPGSVFQQTQGPTAFVWCSVTVLLALGGLCWWLSMLSYEAVDAAVDALATDGSADPFTASVFGRLVRALRVVGSAMVLAGFGLVTFQRAVQRAIGRLLDAALALTKVLGESIRTWARTESTVHCWTLIGLCGVAVAIRLFFLFQPIRYDEAFTFLNYASKPFYVGLVYYEPNNHVFHTVLVHAASRLFGDQLWAIRLPAFFAGLLVIPVAYGVARVLYDKDVAIWTAGWIAVSPAFIEYATNARGYSFLCLTVLTSLALTRSLKHHRNPFAWVLFVVVSVIGFYTVPTMVYPFGAIITWLVLSALVGDTRLARAVLLRHIFVAAFLVGLLVLVCYSPILVAQGWPRVTEFAAPRPWPVFLVEAQRGLAAIWKQWHHGLGPFGNWLVVGFIVSLLLHRRLARDRVSIVVATVLWCVPLLLAQRAIPLPRHWLAFLPLYFAMASAGWCDLLRRFLGRPVVPILTSICVAIVGWQAVSSGAVHTVTPTDHFRDAEDITRFLKDYLTPGDAVLVGVPADAPLEYYFVRHGVSRTYLHKGVDSNQRLLVIAQPPWTSLTSLLDQANTSLQPFSAPEAIRQFHESTVYELRRQG